MYLSVDAVRYATPEARGSTFCPQRRQWCMFLCMCSAVRRHCYAAQLDSTCYIRQRINKPACQRLGHTLDARQCLQDGTAISSSLSLPLLPRDWLYTGCDEVTFRPNCLTCMMVRQSFESAVNRIRNANVQ